MGCVTSPRLALTTKTINLVIPYMSHSHFGSLELNLANSLRRDDLVLTSRNVPLDFVVHNQLRLSQDEVDVSMGTALASDASLEGNATLSLHVGNIVTSLCSVIGYPPQIV